MAVLTEIGYWFVVKEDYVTGLGDIRYTLSKIRLVFTRLFPGYFTINFDIGNLLRRC